MKNERAPKQKMSIKAKALAIDFTSLPQVEGPTGPRTAPGQLMDFVLRQRTALAAQTVEAETVGAADQMDEREKLDRMREDFEASPWYRGTDIHWLVWRDAFEAGVRAAEGLPPTPSTSPTPKRSGLPTLDDVWRERLAGTNTGPDSK